MYDDFLDSYRWVNARSSGKSALIHQYKMFIDYAAGCGPDSDPGSVNAFILVMKVHLPEHIKIPSFDIRQPKDPWRKEHKRRRYSQ